MVISELTKALYRRTHSRSTSHTAKAGATTSPPIREADQHSKPDTAFEAIYTSAASVPRSLSVAPTHIARLTKKRIVAEGSSAATALAATTLIDPDDDKTVLLLWKPQLWINGRDETGFACVRIDSRAKPEAAGFARAVGQGRIQVLGEGECV
jgi:hypothetical protein